MKPSTETFIALAAFEPYNEYGDEIRKQTDLSIHNAELCQWDDYRAHLVDEWRRPPNHIASDSDSAHFDRCTITGMRGVCVNFTAVWL